MNPLTTYYRQISSRLFVTALSSLCLILATAAEAAVTGITGPVFNLTASADYTTQPDGAMIYTWGYGCTRRPADSPPPGRRQARKDPRPIVRSCNCPDRH
jgi:hypothetical protein